MRFLYQTFTFTQHCQHKNTHQNLETKLFVEHGDTYPGSVEIATRSRGRDWNLTRDIWAIYAEYINCPWREQAVNTSSSRDQATHHQWSRVFRLEFRVFKLDRPNRLIRLDTRVFRLDTRDSIIIDRQCENPALSGTTNERGFPKFWIIPCGKKSIGNKALIGGVRPSGDFRATTWRLFQSVSIVAVEKLVPKFVTHFNYHWPLWSDSQKSEPTLINYVVMLISGWLCGVVLWLFLREIEVKKRWAWLVHGWVTMTDVRRTVGCLNADQKTAIKWHLVLDTAVYIVNWLIYLFIYLSIYFCSYLRKGALEKLKHAGIICFAWKCTVTDNVVQISWVVFE